MQLLRNSKFGMAVLSGALCVAGGATVTGCLSAGNQKKVNKVENFVSERFADLQVLRYELPGFEALSLQQKKYVYYLSQACLSGRDITFAQLGRYNLAIRTMLEAIYTCGDVDRGTDEFRALEVYLKRVWFSNGIYHHYASDKFRPGFTAEYLKQVARTAGVEDMLTADVERVMFDEDFMPRMVNRADGEDMCATSAVDFYENVSTAEAHAFYDEMRSRCMEECPSWGLNSTLVKGADGVVKEDVWKAGGKFGKAIEQIVMWLTKAKEVAENDRQKQVVESLIEFYTTGDLATFDRYSIEWVDEVEGNVDFVNGFIEVYDDPIGLKATWEAQVNYKDMVATKRTKTISANAQWFEDNSPVDGRFKKETVKGVEAKAINVVTLAGALFPATAIGINLPNADWIRAQHGSKSVTLTNITSAYDRASAGNGFAEEFIGDEELIGQLKEYGQLYDDLHTDLHECLGHGSGKLLPGVSGDAIKEFHSAIEETRADLFGLYYCADHKLVELGITPNDEAYKCYYYKYMLNGLLTQLSRIEEGKNIEEAHMQNRALIARWVMEHSNGNVELVKRGGKTYLQIGDLAALRGLFAELLVEIQRIKSEGDYAAARNLILTYAVNVDQDLLKEVRERNEKLNIAPYKGFINPTLTPVMDANGEIADVEVSYSEAYDEQMLRYSREFGFLK